MQNPSQQHQKADRFESRAFVLAAGEIRRAGWAALADLGLTDEEIAAYYGIGVGNSRDLAFYTTSARRITPL